MNDQALDPRLTNTENELFLTNINIDRKNNIHFLTWLSIIPF